MTTWMVPMKWLRRITTWCLAASAVITWQPLFAQVNYSSPTAGPSGYAYPQNPYVSQPAMPTAAPNYQRSYYPTAYRQPNLEQLPSSSLPQTSPLPGLPNSGPMIPQGGNPNPYPTSPLNAAPDASRSVLTPQQPEMVGPQSTMSSPMPSHPYQAAPSYSAAPAPSPGPTPSYFGGSSMMQSAAFCGPGGCGPANSSAGSFATNVDYMQSGPANCGWFLNADLMLWSFNAPNNAVFGDPLGGGLVTVNNVTYFRDNTLDSSWINSNFRVGDRYEFGKIENCRGWLVGITNVRYSQSYSATGVQFIPDDPFGLMSGFQDSNGDNIDDDVNGNNVYGRNGQDLGRPDTTNPGSFVAPMDGIIDTPAPVDAGDLVTWLQTFSTVTVTSTLRVSGFEFMDVHRSPDANWCGGFDWFWGFRYLRVRDIYGVNAVGGFLGDTVFGSYATNDIIGPQLGGRWSTRSGPVGLQIEGRFLAGYNFQDNYLRGRLASAVQNLGDQNQPVALGPQQINSTYNNEEFSPVGELRANMTYHINRCVAFRFGYTALVAGGISRANEKIQYTLPSFTLANTANNEVLFGSAINLGLEFNR